MSPFVAVCCFCTKDVKRKGLEPISLALFAADGDRDTEQTFYCHMKCLARTFKDPSILREELGGPKLDLAHYRPVKGTELKKILKAIKRGMKKP